MKNIKFLATNVRSGGERCVMTARAKQRTICRHTFTFALRTDGKLQTKHQKCQYIINLFANKLLEYALHWCGVWHIKQQTIHIQTICSMKCAMLVRLTGALGDTLLHGSFYNYAETIGKRFDQFQVMMTCCT